MTKKLIEQLVTALTHAIARLNALAHNYSDTDFTLLQDALAAGEAEVKFLNGLPPKKPATPEQPATLWLELYNLGEDAGVTFQITQFHQHGGITRIQLDTEDDFFLLPYDTGNGCWLANGKEYIDFSISHTQSDHFKLIDPAILNMECF